MAYGFPCIVDFSCHAWGYPDTITSSSLCVVTEYGRLLVAGITNNGNLGLEHMDGSPTLVPVNGLPPITKVATCDTHTMAIDHDGQLWATGKPNTNLYNLGLGWPKIIGEEAQLTNPTSFTRVPLALPPMKEVAVNTNYTIALSRDGEVWAAGDGRNGQFGGDGPETESHHVTMFPSTLFFEFTKVPLPGGVKIKQISTGGKEFYPESTDVFRETNGYFTLALDDAGGVWAAGSNRMNQLGFNDGRNTIPTFEKVPGLPPIKAISAGRFSSAAIDMHGGLWVSGKTGYNRLGIPPAQRTKLDLQAAIKTNGFVKVDGLPPVIKVSVGDTHTVIVDHNHKAWTTGLNSFHKLGYDELMIQHGVAPDELTSRQTSNFYPIEGLHYVTDVAATQINTLFIRKYGEVLTAGPLLNIDEQPGTPTSIWQCPEFDPSQNIPSLQTLAYLRSREALLKGYPIPEAGFPPNIRSALFGKRRSGN